MNRKLFYRLQLEMIRHSGPHKMGEDLLPFWQELLMSREEKLEQLISDWSQGTFGEWEVEFYPGEEENEIVLVLRRVKDLHLPVDEQPLWLIRASLEGEAKLYLVPPGKEDGFLLVKGKEVEEFLASLLEKSPGFGTL